MRSIVQGLTWMLVGCGCPRLDAVQVDDPDALAAPGQVGEVEAALADFLAWTGGTGVCVPSVRITDDDDLEGALGRWDGDGRPMRIGGGLTSAYATTVHELCHAWDEGADHPSEWEVDRFPPETVTDRAAYPTRRLRIREAFARTCEDGWQDLRLLDDLDARCRLLGGDAADRWVADAVFVDAAPPRPARVVSVDVERHALDGLLGDLRMLDAVVDADTLWLLAMRGRPHHELQPQRLYHVVLGVDLRTREVVATGLMRRAPDERRRFRLIGGADGALLLEEGPQETWLRALDVPDGIGPVLTTLDEPLRWDGATRVGDRVLITDVEDGRLIAVDLGSGARTPVDLDPPLASWQRPFGALVADGEGRVLLGGFTARTGAGALRIDPETGAWETLPLPRGAEAGRLAALPDGRVLTTTSVTLPGDHRLRGVAAVDDAGGLWLPHGCASDRVSTDLRLLTTPGGVWLLEGAEPGDGVPVGRWLTELTVGG